MKSEFIDGSLIFLRPLLEEDLNSTYLHWLNDPETNRYSRRRRYPSTLIELNKFYRNSVDDENIVLAIVDKKSEKHIGNIMLSSISWVDRSADVSILIGDRSHWGKGVATEAIKLFEIYAFETLNMHHLYAGTANPSFVKVMSKLGWVQDGVFEKYLYMNGKYINYFHFTLYNENER